MPDIEKLEDAGLFGRTSEALLGGDVAGVRVDRGARPEGRRR